jgi:hypothetical protein
MPASLAADLIDSVLAVRHSLSAPTWLKPRTIFFCASAVAGRSAASEAAAMAVVNVRRFSFMLLSPGWYGLNIETH